MVQWTKRFETGHALIDSEHRTLIDYINRLEEISCNTNPNRQELEFIFNVVDFVEMYTVTHFRHEESCMARDRCPAYKKNRDAHKKFLAFFQAFKRRFEIEGCRLDILKELHDACGSWIQEHILSVDMKMKKRAKTDLAEN